MRASSSCRKGRWARDLAAREAPSSRGCRAPSAACATWPRRRCASMGERIDDEELERALSDIGGRLAYPDSDLWPAVRARIAERRAAPWWSRFGDRRTALAPVLVTLLVMVVALFTLSPELRARAAEALGLGGVQIFRVAETPRPAPSPSASPPGFWLAGEPHQFFYRDPSGNFQADTLRLAGNTLLWEEGGITHRLEAQVSKDEALRIASSVR